MSPLRYSWREIAGRGGFVDTEIEMYLREIEEGLASVLRCLDGLDEEAIRWKPLPGANGLASIVRHSLANAERNVLGTFVGEPYTWRRDQEFLTDQETAETLRAAWERLRGRMWQALESMPATALATTREHPRIGTVPGRAVLLRAACHASEHGGEAELTRGMVAARDT
jgi:hypothetical protein